jgi:hypothetical protein
MFGFNYIRAHAINRRSENNSIESKLKDYECNMDCGLLENSCKLIILSQFNNPTIFCQNDISLF